MWPPPDALMEEARWLFAGQAVGTYSMLPCPDRVPPRVSIDGHAWGLDITQDAFSICIYFFFELKRLKKSDELIINPLP